MSEAVRLQDPAETLDHSLDWSDWLATADTIDTSTWTVSPSGPTTSSSSHTTTTTTIWLAGVTFGAMYELRNAVTTVGGRTGERSITIRGWKQ